MAHNGGGLFLVADQDGDGTPESTIPVESPTTASILELCRNDTGEVFIATQDRIFVDPIPVP